MNTAYRFGRGIQAGRVWTNCYHATQHMLHSAATKHLVSVVKTT